MEFEVHGIFAWRMYAGTCYGALCNSTQTSMGKIATLLIVFLLSTTLSPAYSDLEVHNSALEYATTAVVYVIGAKNDRTSDSVCVISADGRHIVLSHRGQQGSDTGHIVHL